MLVFQLALLADISKFYCFLLHEAAVHSWQFDFYAPFINAFTYSWQVQQCELLLFRTQRSRTGLQETSRWWEPWNCQDNGRCSLPSLCSKVRCIMSAVKMLSAWFICKWCSYIIKMFLGSTTDPINVSFQGQICPLLFNLQNQLRYMLLSM